MLIHPALLALGTLIALVIGRMSGLNPNPVSILAAAGIALVASELALLPVVLSNSKKPVDMLLRAFVGSVLHLGLSVIMGAVAILGFKFGAVFVYWLLGAYWITLIGLCIVFIRMLRLPDQSAKLSTN